jgi:hypothetical protein
VDQKDARMILKFIAALVGRRHDFDDAYGRYDVAEMLFC